MHSDFNSEQKMKGPFAISVSFETDSNVSVSIDRHFTKHALQITSKDAGMQIDFINVQSANAPSSHRVSFILVSNVTASMNVQPAKQSAPRISTSQPKYRTNVMRSISIKKSRRTLK
jgi:hypothetical protein